ncbi:hypothetical protein [Acanthopleuribacter pedis]|uniref:Uncharacterized protein n=1 Tax=Acanthopleuribacter pedis TaxID=442870 RepID=A0A8J7U3F7_9BACT|nr:hypothetical protein [Acanthopleuribacter pedis]MBO1318298.1 hypothetical protein [Acanthopleuribacter pedis]
MGKRDNFKTSTSDPWTKENCPDFERFQVVEAIARLQILEARKRTVRGRYPREDEIPDDPDELRQQYRELFREKKLLEAKAFKLRDEVLEWHRFDIEFMSHLRNLLNAMGIEDTVNELYYEMRKRHDGNGWSYREGDVTWWASKKSIQE